MEFKETKAYHLVKEFILTINNSVKNEKQLPINKAHILFKIREIVASTPLSEVKGRYANPAMVNVIEEVEKVTESAHLRNAFGNKIRMDFGTGHELNFLCFLYECLNDGSDDCNTISSVNQISEILKEYFSIVRLYITKFNVEAAGSRGCWSIDDYLLLPYLFGAAENFHEQKPIDCIGTGMFKEAYSHNNSMMLKDLCKLSWPTINVGLYKMYVEEVLGRHVVTQHFIYSDLLPEQKNQ